MPRSPSRNARSASRAGRTLYGPTGGDDDGGGVTFPGTLSGVLSWYRGKDLGAASSNITTWADQSGLGRDLGNLTGTAPTVAASTPNSGKAANWGADGYLFNYSALRTTGDVAYVLASSQLDTSTYNAYNVLGVTGNWATTNATMPAYWTVKLNTAKTVTAYTLDVGSSARAPKDWVFQGSQDNSTWTDLDTHTGYTFSGLTGSFTATNSTAYLYYRVYVTAINGGDLLYLTKVTMTGATLNGAQPSALETWMVVKTSGATTNGHPISTTSGTDTYYPFSDGAIYDDYGLNTRIAFFPNKTVSSWRIYRMVHTGTNRFWYLDNVQQYTAAASAPAIKQLIVGRGGQNYFRGAIAEIFTRSQVSDAGEIADIIAYFNTEHGLTVT